MVRSFEAECNRHIASRKIYDTTGDKERRHAARAAFVENHRRFGYSLDTADARSNEDTGRGLLLITFGVPSCIVERLTRRAHRKDNKFVDLTLLLRLHPLVGIVGRVGSVTARDDASDLAGNIGHLEGVDLLRTALAFEETRPSCFHA